MSRLNDLIRQLREKEPALADDISREVGALTDRRAFGLNFERHTPETVELPGHRVRRGDKVRVLPPRGTARTAADDRLWLVEAATKIDGSRTATLAALDGDATAMADVDDLVVVAEFRDPIYPGLVSTGRIERGGDQPFHTVINAENYHALQTLLFTHRSKVDCIYIDPPYNTGNGDWIYNDRYVGGEDLYRHSKWLAFMERRLILARELLTETGIIIVAIGDDEHHRLRMLLDQTLGSDNFISDVVWQGGRKNNGRYVSNSADYMLVYSRDQSKLLASGVTWSDRKDGVDDALAAAQRAWTESRGDTGLANKAFRQWIRANKSTLSDGVARYNSIDGSGRVYFAGDLQNPSLRPNLKYQILHPVTGQPVKAHSNGWRYSREAMDRLIEDDRILFGADHTSTVYYKRYLSDQTDETVSSVFERDRRAARAHLKSILGEDRFPNPKDHQVLARWLRIVASREAVILDFFGGSGTLTEATMALNRADGGARSSILVTNNELPADTSRELLEAGVRLGDSQWDCRGVHEYVTRPRISTITLGQRLDGSEYDNPYDENVEFFDLTYEAPLRVASNREFARIAPLLWIRAGAKGRRIDEIGAGWDVADTYGVIVDFDHAEQFQQELAKRDNATHAFIVTDDDWLFQSICRDLPGHVEPVRLYEAYLRNFEFEAGGGAQ